MTEAQGGKLEEWPTMGWGFRSGHVNHDLADAQGTWWPDGHFHVPRGQLKYLLAKSGRHHARQAVTSVASDNTDVLLQAASSAGTAVELLAKGALTTVDPRLLVSPRDPHQALLVLGGHTTRSKLDPLSLQSIGAREALQLAGHLFPAVPAATKAAHALAARNAALHMGLVDVSYLRVAIREMCEVVDALLRPLGLERDPFWGEALGMAGILLDEALSDRQRVTDTKVAAARRRFEELTRHLPADAAAVVVAALSTRRPYVSLGTEQHDELVDCPACGQKGWLACVVDRGPLQTDTTGRDIYQYVERTAYPASFDCPVCNLSLEDERELSGFSFPDVELEPDFEPYEALLWESDDENLTQESATPGDDSPH